MAYTVYEYASVSPTGAPLEPAATRTASKALGASHRCAASTVFVAVVPDADMYLRISEGGTAATTADYKLTAGQSYGFPIGELARPYLYGIAV